MEAKAVPTVDPSALTQKDFKSDQEVRWCPGCGDYSILAQMQRTLPRLDIAREKYVFVGGIGCAARFPYYMNTYGVHGIHGRAPAIATGIKAVRPDLSVWVITGDGDSMSIGGNHLLHVLRRNVNVKIMLFNNRVYGLTKGQYSPTSLVGTRTKSTPQGSIDYPVDPVRFALGCGAGFVARVIDIDAKHFQAVIERAAHHTGTTLVEIYQNCPIFNDGAFATLTDKSTKDDHLLYVEHGKKMIFGKNGDKGIAMDREGRARVVDATSDDVVVHDEASDILALFLSRLDGPELPTPVGVFRAVERAPYETLMNEQIERQRAARGGTVQQLLESGETWRVG